MTNPAVAADLEILLSNGTTWQPLTLVEQHDSKTGDIQHKTLATQLRALVADLPLSQQLQSQLWTNRGGGIGIDYNAAYGLNTRTPGIVIPAGKMTSVTVPLGVGNTNTNPLVAIEEFGSSLFIAQEGSAATYGGRIIRSSDGTGTGGGAFANVTMTDYGLGYITAGEYMRDLCLFGDGTGSGARYLYASSSDASWLNGRLHRTLDGVNWSSTPAGRFGTNGRNRMWRTFWTDRSGLSWPRLFCISGVNKISYTRVGGDPFVAADWIEGVEIDTAKQLLNLAGSRRHVFMGAQDNLYDVNEYGESIPLTSYWQQMPQTGNAAALQYMNGYLYASLGRGLDRVYVDSATPLLQEAIGQCAPGWGTRAENDVRGYVTAMCPDQTYLVAAMYNQSVNKTFVCWGLPKTQRPDLRDDSANPLLWYGPEALADSTYQVTRMRTSALTGDMRLWILSQSIPGTVPVLHWLSLPMAGAPLQDMISAGGMRFNDGTTGAGFWQRQATLEGLAMPWNGATQIADQVVTVSRGLSVVRAADGTTTNDGFGTKLQLSIVADPAPGPITWPSADDVTITPSQTINPSATKKGERIRWRYSFLSPQATASTPKIGVLDACRFDSWVISPSAVALPTLTVQYGGGIRNLSNTESVKDPEWVTTELKALTESGRTLLKTRDGSFYTLKLTQMMETRVEYDDTAPYGKVVTATLDGVLLSVAS